MPIYDKVVMYNVTGQLSFDLAVVLIEIKIFRQQSYSHVLTCVGHGWTDDVSISGFKDAVSEQSATESAAEAVIGQEQEGGVSPDTVSATSQSIDEPTKDLVRYHDSLVQTVKLSLKCLGS